MKDQTEKLNEIQRTAREVADKAQALKTKRFSIDESAELDRAEKELRHSLLLLNILNS